MITEFSCGVVKRIMIIRLKKIQLRNIVFLFAMISLLYNSGSFWISCNDTLGIVLLLISMIFIIVLQKPVCKKEIIVFAVICIGILINVFLTDNVVALGTNIRLMVIILFAILFTSLFTYQEFIPKYINAIIFLTIIAIIVHVLVNYFNINSWLKYFPVLTNTNGFQAYNCILFCIYTGYQKRLMSIFWEPSIYSTMALIALFLELFFKKRFCAWKVVILVLGILFSQSTGGYLLLAYLGISFLITKSENIYFQSIVFFIVSVAMIVAYQYKDVILAYLIRLNPMVFSKLDISLQKVSLIERADSGLINLTIFKNHFITGVGFGKVEEEFHALGGGAETSTITYFLAAYGILGITYTVFYVTAFLKQRTLTLLIRIFLLIFFTIILLKEPYWFIVIVWIIFMYFFKDQIPPNSLMEGNNEEIPIRGGVV